MKYELFFIFIICETIFKYNNLNVYVKRNNILKNDILIYKNKLFIKNYIFTEYQHFLDAR